MADIIELKATDLAAMLCSRVCHDLINPVGAIGNGLEVLADPTQGAMAEGAQELIANSAKQARAKLEFARLAYEPRAASIFGDVFWVRGALHVLGGGCAVVVSALVEHELLERRQASRWLGEEELSFRDPLVREAAYATLTEADRTRGHALAGAWLQSVSGTGERVPK